MNLAAIIHRTTNNDCYAVDEDTIEINLRTGYEVEKVYIYHGDPFAGGILGGNWQWKGEKEEIKTVIPLSEHKLWSMRLKPPYKRVKYYFEIISKDDDILYFEDGFYHKDEIEGSTKTLQCFTMPWLNPADVNRIPRWVNDTVWYQIFPDRFCNGNKEIDDERTLPWNSKEKVRNEDIYGGDLYGIVSKLDYLHDLGITGIYMTPIFDALSTHKYDTTDYFEIDPHFGNKEIMKSLVEEAHIRGMKVMLDGVFNHCGREFKPWKDVQENGPKSKYYPWFMVNQWPFDTTKHHTHDKEFYSFAFTTGMPKLNTNHDEVIDYICQIGEYWVKEFDIDGWRLDVANEVSHKLCKEFRRRVQKIKPDIYILGEIWHDSMQWLQGDEFDAVMNYPLTTAINDFWIQNETKRVFEHKLNDCYHRYMSQTNDVLFNLLDSHDTDRLIHRVNGNIDIFYQQMAILFTVPGSPCIFYGTEIIQDGAHDPECRACMPWDEIEKGIYDERIKKMKDLIALRKNYAACKHQYIHFSSEYPQERLLEYYKKADGVVLQILVNASDSDVEIKKGKVIFENRLEGTCLKKDGVVIMEVTQ